MDAYEIMAASVSSIELAVEHYFVGDDCSIRDYRGPQLLVAAHGARLVTIHEHGRELDELPPERMVALLDLAVAACEEPQAPFGVDTAIGRPTTTYRLSVYRALREAERACRHRINGYAAHPLHPAFSAFVTALREATGPLPPTAAHAWDHAARWLGPRDLGPLWHAGQPVPLPSIVCAFSDDDAVYFRAGQPPQRSELYRLNSGGELAWLRDHAAPVALAGDDGHRWVLPCGAGIVEVHHAWQEPRRIYVRIDDPVRGLYVQRA